MEQLYEETEIHDKTGFFVELTNLTGKVVYIVFYAGNTKAVHIAHLQPAVVLSKKIEKYAKKGLRYWRSQGSAALAGKIVAKVKTASTREIPYQKWILRHLPSQKELEKQKREKFEFQPKISIVIPLYKTPEKYLRQLVETVKAQTYPNWELCLSDGSGANSPITGLLKELEASDERIKVVSHERALQISENTNAGIEVATGDYIAFADHDDELTPHALFECVKALNKDRKIRVLYSDEDKMSMDGHKFFQPHFKPDYNPDLLCTVNYICHLFVVDRKVIDKVGMLRSEFDGAQDYDFIFRCIEAVDPSEIYHIPKILYHWRCHEASTAANPHSKKYAYEAGLRALQDHAAERGIPAKAEETRHVGFYRLQYTEVLQERPDVAAVGGRVLSGKNRGRIAGGRMTADGKVFYEGLPKDFGGYLHRAELSQDAEALDLRCIRIRSADRELFEKIVGVPYTEVVRGPEQQPVFDSSTLPAGADIRLLSLQLSEALRKRGRLLYLPEYPEKWERL